MTCTNLDWAASADILCSFPAFVTDEIVRLLQINRKLTQIHDVAITLLIGKHGTAAKLSAIIQQFSVKKLFCCH